MQGSGHGFDLHAAIFCAEGHLVTLADDADLAEPDGLARLEFPFAANADEGRGIAEIVAADQGLILVGCVSTLSLRMSPLATGVETVTYGFCMLIRTGR